MNHTPGLESQQTVITKSKVLSLLVFSLLLLVSASIPGTLQAQRLFLTNSHFGKTQTFTYNFNGSSPRFLYEIKNLTNGDARIKVEAVNPEVFEGTGFSLIEGLPFVVQNGESKKVLFKTNYAVSADEEVRFSLKIIPLGSEKSEADAYIINFVFTAKIRILFWDPGAKKYVSELPGINLNYAKGKREQIVEIRRNGSSEEVNLSYSIVGSGKRAFSVFSNEIQSRQYRPGQSFKMKEGLKSLVIRYSPIGSPQGATNSARLVISEKGNPESVVSVNLEGIANGGTVSAITYVSKDPVKSTKKDPPVVDFGHEEDLLNLPDKNDPNVGSIAAKDDSSNNNKGTSDPKESKSSTDKEVKDEFYGENGNKEGEDEIVRLSRDEEMDMLLEFQRNDTLRMSVDSVNFKHHFGPKYWKFFGDHSMMINLSNEALTERNEYIGKLRNVRFHPDRMYLYTGYDTISYYKEAYDFDPESGILVLAIPVDTTVDDTLRPNFTVGISLKPVYKQGNRYVRIDSSDVPWRPVVAFAAKKKPFNKGPLYWTIGILFFIIFILILRWFLNRPYSKLNYLKEPQYLRHRSSRFDDIDRSKRVAKEIEVDLNKSDSRLIQLKWPEEIQMLMNMDVPAPEESGFIRFLKKITFVRKPRFQAFYYSLRIEPIEEKLPSKLNLRDHSGLLLLETELTGDILATDHQDFLLTKNGFLMNIYIDPEEILKIDESGTRTSDTTSIQIPFRIYEEPFWGFTRVEEFVVPLRIVLREIVR